MPNVKDKDKSLDDRILSVLSASGQPLSAYALLDKLRKSGVKSPPLVYRALDRLTARGLVHRVESLSAFVACAHVRDHAHEEGVSSFAICTSCGHVEEIDAQPMQQAMKKMGKKFLAQVDRKAVEISGICHECQTKEKGRKHV